MIFLRQIMPVVLLLLLPAGLSSAAWLERATVTTPEANLTLTTRWAAESGLHLRVSTPDGGQTADFEITGKSGGVSLNPKKDFHPALTEEARFTPDALPRQSLEKTELLLKFREEYWAVYLNHRLVMQLPPPFPPPVVVRQLTEELPAGATDNTYLQKIEDFDFHDDFLVAEGEENVLSAWTKESGDWQLHSAVDNAVERQNLAPGATNVPEPGRSPNFYSLKGKGAHALITSGYDFSDDYTFEAAVQTEPGEMGLAFYAPEESGYHAFTLKMAKDSVDGLLRLWRTPARDTKTKEVLGAAKVELTPGQWMKLKVTAAPDRIRCWLDNTLIFDLAADLPPGGRFGLYADSDTGIRFDDVLARTNHDLDLRQARDLRRYLLAEHGRFFAGRGLSGFLRGGGSGDRLEVPAASEPQWLAAGSVRHRGHVFAADFTFSSSTGGAGLMAGYTGSRQPYYRFICRRDAAGEQFRLEKVTRTSAELLEELTVPTAAGSKPAATVRLMADGTGDGLRLYRNGELVLFTPLDGPPPGASGLYVEPGTKVDIANPEYRFTRTDLYRNKFEKNRIFVEDPFMRHWSSPEGEWIDDRVGHLWYKGDFFGRFVVRLPFIPGSQLHFGVEEGKLSGPLAVLVRQNDLILTDQPEAGAAARALATVKLADLTAGDGDFKSADSTKWFSLHAEGRWVWLTSGNRRLFKQALAAPLAGRRMRLEGFTTDQLKFSYVERYNIQDFLFTESLYEWSINGGSWEVVNRFQCQPRWSNMDGESRDGLAAIWAKYRFSGDFCVEMYAGMRHGWYDRPGDLNLTVLNRDNTPSQGYTITCTGWDPDHSQLYTRLFRNGVLLEKTDKYLVPRVREGSVRAGYNPLTPGGRDVHGAWYYLKFRKIGSRLEYSFDNEPVFAVTDPEPLKDGSLGVWTFMNSMVVARVKIAAERIGTRPLAFTPIPVAAAAETEAKPATLPFAPVAILDRSQSLGAMDPALWQSEDPVGQASLTWHTDAVHGPYFALRNVAGSGALPAQSRLAPEPYRNVAGWRFLVKRTPNAQFNFHFAVGQLQNGQFSPQQQYFYRISGTDFSRGAWKMTGAVKVHGTPGDRDNWHAQDDWTVVEVWLPTEGMKSYQDSPTAVVQVQGFGNFQPSDELQGLTGNGPGEGYAVSDFTVIRYVPPMLSLRHGIATPDSITLTEIDPPQKPVTTAGSLEAIQNWISGCDRTGLIRLALVLRKPGEVTRYSLSWINLPAEPDVACTWSNWEEPEPNAVVLRSSADYPDRRFCFAEMTLGTTPVTLAGDGFKRRMALVPRQEAFSLKTLPEIPVTATLDGKVRKWTLKWQDNPRQEPPVLVKIEGLTPFLENFESRQFGKNLAAVEARMTLRNFDFDQGSYLEVANHGSAQRLVTPFAAPVNLARYPVFLFRYRAPEMARVSLVLKEAYYVRLSEAYDSAINVRPAAAMLLDGKWHTWQGVVSDAVVRTPFTLDVFDCHSLRLASVHAIDQTGLYTRWDLDDLAFGPAVAKPEQLRCVPQYFDFDGIAEIQYAVRAGPESYHDLLAGKMTELNWIKTSADGKVEPELKGLPDGLCHLFLKAKDPLGNESVVTDLPFLLDTAPPVTQQAFVASTDPFSNGTELSVTVNLAGGAPLDMSQMQLKWDEIPVKAMPRFSSFQNQPGADILGLNWPHIFRNQLDLSADGQTHQIVLSKLQDGAGNPAADIVIPVKIDYAADKTPPTLLATTLPENILWYSNLEAPNNRVAQFKTTPEHLASLTRVYGEEPYILSKGAQNQVTLWRAFGGRQKWPLASYPALAFRARLPAWQAGGKTTFDVVLECTPALTLTLPLMRTGTTPEPLADLIHLEPAEWQAKAWQFCTLDVGGAARRVITKEETDRLQKAAGNQPPKAEDVAAAVDKRLAELQVDKLSFLIRQGPAEFELHLQSLFVFAPWRPTDSVKLAAYDASGIGGLTYQAKKATAVDTMVFTPATLPAEDKTVAWFQLNARDKAGNLSLPVYIPQFNFDGNIGPKTPGAPAGNDPADEE